MILSKWKNVLSATFLMFLVYKFYCLGPAIDILYFLQTEIIRSDEILDGHLTMKEVCRIYGLYSKVNKCHTFRTVCFKSVSVAVHPISTEDRQNMQEALTSS